MTLGRPSVKITGAGLTLTASEAGLSALRIRLSRGSHDEAELLLWPRSKLVSLRPGDELSIQLGYVDQEVDVWAGVVSTARYEAGALVITGHAPTLLLSGERKSRTYVSQTVADIVRDLASSITVDAADVTTTFSYYAVDHRRSVWGHLLDLAELCGAEISCSPTGGLRFQPVNVAPTRVRFRYGAELLSWRVGTNREPDAGTWVPHGSASDAGAARWHWVHSDPTAGAGEARVAGAFHASDQADALSNAARDGAKRAAVGGEIELVGRADLRAGDAFSLADLASGDPGPLRALAVLHELDAARGFRTRVQVEGASP